MTGSHIEPIPEAEADPEPEAEQDVENYDAELEDPVELENYLNITEMREPIEEYTAEIDVELSESEEEDDASLKTRTEKEEDSSLISCSDIAYGNYQLKKNYLNALCSSTYITSPCLVHIYMYSDSCGFSVDETG